MTREAHRWEPQLPPHIAASLIVSTAIGTVCHEGLG
jgi:hypothetical protein